jgi:hypothetical protein
MGPVQMRGRRPALVHTGHPPPGPVSGRHRQGVGLSVRWPSHHTVAIAQLQPYTGNQHRTRRTNAHLAPSRW